MSVEVLVQATAKTPGWPIQPWLEASTPGIVRPLPATPSLRLGVERGMVATLASAGPLLVLESMPAFFAERAPGSPLVLLSLMLVALACLLVPVALLRQGRPAYVWLRLSFLSYVGLVALERLEIRSPLPVEFTPWFIGLACVTFSCLAIGMQHSLHAGIGSSLIIAGLVAAYAGRVVEGDLVVDVVGLAALAAGLIGGVRALRRRADGADEAHRAAQERFDSSRRHAALEEERVRTDPLLHDSVLTTLLIAAAGQTTRDRTVVMARNSLDVVSTRHGGTLGRGSTDTFAGALAAVEHEFIPMCGLVQLDLAAAHAIELPTRVADTLIAAMLQALSNSIKHAGPAAARVALAEPVSGNGVRITIRDDESGFDTTQIAPERLGVRVSILEQMRLIGGVAGIRSTPGHGTTVVLEWRPGAEESESASERPDGRTRVTVIPRALLYGALAAVVALAIFSATAQAAFVYQAVGPVIAAALGTALFPALLGGARSGAMRPAAAWAVALVGCVLCCTATIGLQPDRLDCVSISWYTCGVLAGAVMLWMSGHRLPPLTAVTCLLLQVLIWAGPAGMLRLGLPTEIVIVVAGLTMHRALLHVTEATRAARAKEREIILWQAEQNAFHLERKTRLQLAGYNAGPMLHRIIDCDGELDAASRAECRVLEQTIRDEIRGRRLLNDAVRRAVLAQRQRGAFVQVLDDGGLDDLPAATLNPLLDELAQKLDPVRSTRVVIRTARPDSAVAVTVVASSPDETAVALGLDDEQVDLWLKIPRPATLTR